MGWKYDDDFDIDERTGDFNLFSEAYGYDRKGHWEDDDEDLEFDEDADSDDY